MGRTESKAAPRRRLWWWVGGLAGLVVIIGVLFAIGYAVSGDEPQASPRESATPSASPSPEPTALPSTSAPQDGEPIESAAPIPPERPALPMDDESVDDQGIVISLVDIESVSGEASAPGETSGPAVRITARIENGSDEDLSLRYAVVNAYYGADRNPAPPIMQPGGDPFSGTIRAGASAEGVYLFSIPSDARETVTVAVDYLPGESTAIFSGPVD